MGIGDHSRAARSGAVRFAGAAIASLLAVASGAQNWTDRAEYDKVLEIQAERTPEKKLQLLGQWKEKYPGSPLARYRSELFLTTYEALGDWARVFQTAREMTAASPDNMVGVYWTALLGPGAADNSPEALKATEASARKLLAGPAPGADAASQKVHLEAVAHRALGWVAWQQGELDTAERELLAALAANGQNAEVSSWLGLILAAQKTPEKQSAAVWHLARAAFMDREGALPTGQRRDVRQALDKVYTAYHGSDEGLQDIATLAKQQALPAAGFRVETAAAIAERRQQEELRRTNPQLADWLDIRKKLDAADGEKYFAESLQAKPLPKLKGKVIRCSPERRPKEITLGISSVEREEVQLQLAEPLPNCADPGTEIEFEGTASAFAKDPFLLTVATTADGLTGWPAAPRTRRN